MYRFFHLCDHAVRSKENVPHERDITIRNSGDDVDTIIDGGILVGIRNVRVLTHKKRATIEDFQYDEDRKDQRYEDVDPGDGFYDGSNYYLVNYEEYFRPGQTISDPIPKEFYRPFLHNRIKWLVEPPLTYIVEATVRFSSRKMETYSLRDCPYCQGKGWFVDIINTKGKFSKDVGVMKIAQRVVKDLLTELHSNVLNLEYGTIIKQTVSGVVKDDAALFDDIRLIVSEVEDKYLLRQQEEYDLLAADERMVKLLVESIRRSPVDARNLIMDLKIETESEVKTFRFTL